MAWRNAQCTGRFKRSQERRLRRLRALLSNPANRRRPNQLGPGSYPSRLVLIDSPHEKGMQGGVPQDALDHGLPSPLAGRPSASYRLRGAVRCYQ